jgi:hypothetical protein
MRHLLELTRCVISPVGLLALDRRSLPEAGMAVPDATMAWRPSPAGSIAGFRFAGIFLRIRQDSSVFVVCAFGGDSATPKRLRYKLRLPRRSAGGCNLRVRLLDRNAVVGNSDRDARRLDADADDTAGCPSFLPAWHLNLSESPGSSVGLGRSGLVAHPPSGAFLMT